MLPPNLRLPNHIALATTLFSPVNRIITAQNDYEYDSQFDTGTAGQVGVLEFLLQSYVHSDITIEDGDGTRFDFRVSIPRALSQQQIGEINRLVDRHRLRSKRYEVSEGPNAIDTPSNTTIIRELAWAAEPSISSEKILLYGVNRSGIFRTKIFNLTTGGIVVDADVQFTAGEIRQQQLPSSGQWKLEVGTLQATIGGSTPDIHTPDVVTTAPAWLTFLGYTFDANTREASIWINRTVDTKLKIERVDGSPISGSTWNNIPWDNAKWIEGTTEWAAPYSEVFRLNPVGSSGLYPGQEYRVSVASAADNSTIFTQTFKLPAVSQLMPPQEIVLSTQPELAACGRGPTVVSIDLVTSAQIVWHFDGEGIEGIKTYLKDLSSGSIIRNNIIQVAKKDSAGNFQAVFSPGNQPRWTFDVPLPPGTYQLGNEGANCKSVISWSNSFKIEGATPINPIVPINPVGPINPINPTGPVTPLNPQLGEYKSYQRLRTFPGLMKLTETPVAGGFSYTDEVISTPPSGYEVSYVINEKRYLGMGRLVNYVHQFPGPLSIRKCFSRVGISSLSVGPNNQPGAGPADTDAVTFMGYGAQYAQIDIVYIKQ